MPCAQTPYKALQRKGKAGLSCDKRALPPTTGCSCQRSAGTSMHSTNQPNACAEASPGAGATTHQLVLAKPCTRSCTHRAAASSLGVQDPAEGRSEPHERGKHLMHKGTHTCLCGVQHCRDQRPALMQHRATLAQVCRSSSWRCFVYSSPTLPTACRSMWSMWPRNVCWKSCAQTTCSLLPAGNDGTK
jgi:hypothetical protein